jgi:hypothetical protein
MFIENILIRPQGTRDVSISWTSPTADARSFVLINSKLVVGAYRAETINRSIALPVPTDKTYKIEVFDVTEDETIPHSFEESPLVQPVISWNAVENAVAYKIYHTIFDTGSIESLLLTIPARLTGRIEISCPIKLEGKNGRWHYFRIETVDQYGHESVNEIVPYFAADLPPVPDLMISRNIETGLFSFRIVSFYFNNKENQNDGKTR